MKLRVLLLITFSFIHSSLLWAQHAEGGGGQSGGGGNGCWVNVTNSIPRYTRGVRQKWKSVEELLYSNLINEESINPTKILFPYSTSYLKSVSSFSLWHQSRSNNFFERLKVLERSNPKVFELLMEMSQLFEHSYVVNVTVDGLFNADFAKKFPRCFSFAPALLTLEDGTIIFFRPIWDRIDPITSEILLIHETIRLAQAFHPAFKNFSNANLQFLTALLFSKSIKQHQIEILLHDVEKNLREGNFKIPSPVSVTIYNTSFIDTKAAFRNKFHEALRENQPLSRELNDLRMNNVVFKMSTLKNIKDKFIK